MKKRFWLAGAALTAAALLAALWWITPGLDRPELPEGAICVRLESDGQLALSWPEAGSAYTLEIAWDGGCVQQRCEQPGALLTDVTLPFQVRVQAVRTGRNLLGMNRELVSNRWMEAQVPDLPAGSTELTGQPGTGLVTLRWASQADHFYEISLLEEGRSVPVASTEQGELVLRVGQDGELPLPSYEQPLQLVLRAGRRGEGCLLYGPPSAPLVVERGELLGDQLSLDWRETASRTYTLQWSETRGDYFELQEWQDGQWRTLERLEPAQSLHYDTGRLDSGSRHRYQVVARDRDGGEIHAEQAEFYASVSPLYATIWPITDLACFDSPGGDKPLGKIPAGTTLCVLEEQGDWFQVRYHDQYVYVDSRYCMINLAEYTGDYCAYDITNSYASIFKVHESPVAGITKQVIPGFEHMRTSEDFLVPYLYPCAQKLLAAAQAAMADGYRLKIYEAFRPNQATRYLYDTAAALLDAPALVVDEDGRAVDPVTGYVVDLSSGLLLDPVTGEPLPPPEPEEPPEEPLESGGPDGMDEPDQSTEEPSLPDEPQLPEEEWTGEDEGGLEIVPPEEGGDDPETLPPPEIPLYDSYGKIMTDSGRFRLGSFLAAVASAHNRGIALDLTLETLDGGRELEMQSAMHDLSWYSAVYRNNDNARLLEGYMTGVGMRGLSSEWWHFQDDETREAIGLTGYLYQGVDAGGWTRDDRGWRCREADGSYRRSTTITVDGRSFTLDDEGYVVE